MRYFYEKPNKYTITTGKTHYCRHPIYLRCTLYTDDKRGLAVIQQRYLRSNRHTYWSEIDPWLVDDIGKHELFNEYFEQFAAESMNNIYPTVTVRQIMWGLKMKPLPKMNWETVFDHKIYNPYDENIV